MYWAMAMKFGLPCKSYPADANCMQVSVRRRHRRPDRAMSGSLATAIVRA